MQPACELVEAYPQGQEACCFLQVLTLCQRLFLPVVVPLLHFPTKVARLGVGFEPLPFATITSHPAV